MAFLIFADQLSKFLVSRYMQLHQSIEIIKGFLKITYVHNTGAAWSILSGFRYGFIVVALAAAAAMFYWLYSDEKLTKLERLIIVVILAGTLGNVIDRIAYGYVIDFIDTYPFGYDFPVFNVADMCLTVSCGALILDILLKGNKNG